MSKKQFTVWHFFSILLLLFDLLFIAYPLFNVLKNSVLIEGQFSLAYFRKFFGESYYFGTLINSI